MVLPRRACSLSFQFENSNGGFESCELIVLGVEAFKCTYMTSLTVEMIESAYDKLVDVGESDWLRASRNVNCATGTPASLKHLRICFDDGPCYEFLCGHHEVRMSS